MNWTTGKFRGVVSAVALVVIALLCSAAPRAQTPADHWELGIFHAGVDPAAGAPFSVTVYPSALVTCGLPIAFRADVAYANAVEGPADNVPNPRLLAFSDPNDALRECRADVTSAVLALPLGVGYRGAMRAVSTTGSKSAWSTPSNTFRRAPRGLPCANGTGVEMNVNADVNGKATNVTLCLQP